MSSMNQSGDASVTMNSVRATDSLLGGGGTLMGDNMDEARSVPETWPMYLLKDDNKWLATYKLIIKVLVIPTVAFNLYFITFGFGKH